MGSTLGRRLGLFCAVNAIVLTGGARQTSADVIFQSFQRWRNIVVDGGAAPAAPPINYETTVATMPDVGGGSSLTAAGVSQQNLGAFDIQIVPGPALAGNAQALAAFNQAAAFWEAFIADPITVQVDANIAPLGPSILGQTGSELLTTSYSTIRNAMVMDSAAELDDAIVASLPIAANYNVTLPAGFGLDGGSFASKANLEALGFTGLDAVVGTVFDMHMTFSSNFAFDYDQSNGITAGQFDFVGVAIHEIGHGLGFISGVDDVDFILPGGSNQIQPTPLDMFRFRDNVAQDPATVADFANLTLNFPRNMVPQHIAIFDQILGGSGGDVEVLMSRGVDFGDGQQASHFKDNLGLGIMDPTAAPGQLLAVTANDLRSFDLIGYEINVAAIPEAGAWLFGGVATCLVGLGYAWQRRK
jgi:hypothetical protein